MHAAGGKGAPSHHTIATLYAKSKAIPSKHGSVVKAFPLLRQACIVFSVSGAESRVFSGFRGVEG